MTNLHFGVSVGDAITELMVIAQSLPLYGFVWFGFQFNGHRFNTRYQEGNSPTSVWDIVGSFDLIFELMIKDSTLVTKRVRVSLLFQKKNTNLSFDLHHTSLEIFINQGNENYLAIRTSNLMIVFDICIHLLFWSCSLSCLGIWFKV